MQRVLWCSGKIYYELLAKQQADNRTDVAVARLEQLYPFPTTQYETIMAQYENAETVWVQEEPENMGAWRYFLSQRRRDSLDVIARKPSASPATGHFKIHEREQNKIIERAFDLG